MYKYNMLLASTADNKTLAVFYKGEAIITGTEKEVKEALENIFTHARRNEDILAHLDSILSNKYVNIFRVQGGVGPNASRFRFVLTSTNKVKIVGNDRLYVTFKDEGRVLEFWTKRGDEAQVFMAKVNKKFFGKMMSEAVPQEYGKAFPEKPQFGDASKTNYSVGLPKEYFDDLLKNMKTPEILKIK